MSPAARACVGACLGVLSLVVVGYLVAALAGALSLPGEGTLSPGRPRALLWSVCFIAAFACALLARNMIDAEDVAEQREQRGPGRGLTGLARGSAFITLVVSGSILPLTLVALVFDAVPSAGGGF